MVILVTCLLLLLIFFFFFFFFFFFIFLIFFLKCNLLQCFFFLLLHIIYQRLLIQHVETCSSNLLQSGNNIVGQCFLTSVLNLTSSNIFKTSIKLHGRSRYMLRQYAKEKCKKALKNEEIYISNIVLAI